MSERLKVGDRVRIKDSADYRAGEWVTVVDVEFEDYIGDMTYYVRPEGALEVGFWPDNRELDIDAALAFKAGKVTLSAEDAERVRAALVWAGHGLLAQSVGLVRDRVVRFEVTLPEANADAVLWLLKDVVDEHGGSYKEI